jgi:hypothetical protein
VTLGVGVTLGVTLGVGVGDAHGGISYVCEAGSGGFAWQKSCVRNPAPELPWTPETY